jgi:hypothetical protein
MLGVSFDPDNTRCQHRFWRIWRVLSLGSISARTREKLEKTTSRIATFAGLVRWGAMI